MLNRRRFFAVAAGLSASPVLARAGNAASLDGIMTASMRGSIDATEMGVYPGALDDQSKAFARMLQTASDRDMPLFLTGEMHVPTPLEETYQSAWTGFPAPLRPLLG